VRLRCFLCQPQRCLHRCSPRSHQSTCFCSSCSPLHLCNQTQSPWCIHLHGSAPRLLCQRRTMCRRVLPQLQATSEPILQLPLLVQAYPPVLWFMQANTPTTAPAFAQQHSTPFIESRHDVPPPSTLTPVMPAPLQNSPLPVNAFPLAWSHQSPLCPCKQTRPP